MQGALRAPFLLKAGLGREEFVGTTNVISTVVDLARLTVYAAGFTWLVQRREYGALGEWRTLALVGAACAAGCMGSYLAKKRLGSVTMRGVRLIVSLLLFVAAAALGAGIV